MPPKVEITGSDHFGFVAVKIENDLGVYQVIVKDGGIVMKREVPALIGELKLPEWKVVFKDGAV